MTEAVEFYTTEEVSTLLNVSVYTVRTWIKNKKLKAYKLGSTGWRINKNDLTTFLESNSNQK